MISYLKKHLLFIVLFCIILFALLFILFNKSNNDIISNNNITNNANNSMFAIMLETEAGSGTYEKSVSGTWPGDGFIFNDNLSVCENGSELSWNEELGAISLKTNIADKCYVYFDMYIIPVINSVTTSNIETDSITLTVNVTNGNNPVTTYYYSNNNGSSYVSSNSNTYTFSGLDMGTVYNFSVYVEDSVGYKSEVYTLNETTDDTVLLADWVISQYGGVQGNNGIYYHTSSLANSAGDNSYRYSGANPNNYVCFGSDASPCPSDNLYRIIGVFDGEVKLIRNTSIGNYAWDSENSNAWSTSTVKSILNTTFLNTLSYIWQNKIATHAYKVGGGIYTYLRDGTAKTAYNYEVGTNSNSATDSMKIGIMYVSDYGFAVSNNYWNEELVDYNNATLRNSNWIYLGVTEWTISRSSNNSNGAFYVNSTGFINTSSNDVTIAQVVRPCFYLNSNITYIGGTGTSSDPIRIQ